MTIVVIESLMSWSEDSLLNPASITIRVSYPSLWPSFSSFYLVVSRARKDCQAVSEIIIVFRRMQITKMHTHFVHTYRIRLVLNQRQETGWLTDNITNAIK